MKEMNKNRRGEGQLLGQQAVAFPRVILQKTKMHSLCVSLPILALLMSSVCVHARAAEHQDVNVNSRALLQLNSTGDTIPEDVILFGQSAALTGTLAGLGIDYRDGILAAFQQVNDDGGVNGKRMKLITYNDMYEPGPAVENTKKLITDDKVFALIGQVGTPTSAVTLPVAEAAKVPFLAPYTGAEFLRKPFKKDVVNIRASYIDETAALVDYFVRVEKITRISLFYQNDSFGGAGKDGVELALDELSLPVYTYGTYERNSLDVLPGLEAIYSKPNPPDAIIMIATSKQLAAFVKESRRLHPQMVYFATPSPGATGQATIDALGDAYEYSNIYVSQVVPLPTDTNLTLVNNYRNALESFNSSLMPGFVSLEGYMAGMMAANALEGYMAMMDTDELDNQDFLNYIYNTGILDVGEWRLGPYGGNCTQLSTGCQCNQGMREVFLTQISKEGTYELVPDYTFQFSTCGYEPVIPEPVLMGQTVPLSGPYSTSGLNFQMGILAAFQEVNVRGGIEGHQLKLISYNDEGDPVLAANNTAKLIEEDNVFALMGTVGDSTSKGVFSVAVDAGVPFIAPVSGSSAMRKPFNRNVLNVRGGYNEEVAGLINTLFNKGAKDLSLVIQSTISDKSMIQTTFTEVLSESGMQPHGIAIIDAKEMTAKDVTGMLQGKSPPDAMIIMGPNEFVGSLIGIASISFPDINFFATISSVDEETISQTIPQELFKKVIVSQVVPSPTGNKTALSENYKNALFAYDPDLLPDFISMEGYLAGRFTISVMQNVQSGNLFTAGISFADSREEFLKAVYAQEYFVIDGYPLGPFYDTPCSQYGEALQSQIKASAFENEEYFCPCNDGAHEVFSYTPVASASKSNGNTSEGNTSFKFVSEFYYETCSFVAGSKLVEQTKEKEKQRNTLIGIIVGVLAVLILGSVVGVILFMKHVKKAKEDALMSTWKINYDELDFDRLLGEGASGKTFLGKYRGTDVVIKQLDRNAAASMASSLWKDLESSALQDKSPIVAQNGSKSKSTSAHGASTAKGSRTKKHLEHEIHMLYKLRHPNIRLFMGAHIGIKTRARSRSNSWRKLKVKRLPSSASAPEESVISPSVKSEDLSPNVIDLRAEDHPSDSIYIVSEYMSRGTLYDVLTNPTIDLNTHMQASFLRDIAKGMDFLHRQVPPVIHVDIKSKNMLLDDRWMVKVADFGHSLILDSLVGHKSRIGTPYWCAPEVLSGAPNSTASDVYSFAIVMWEVFSRKELYDGMDENTVLEGVKGGGLRPSIPSACPVPIQELMQRCWNQDPEARPGFSEIFTTVQEWLDENPERALPIPGAALHHQSSQLVSKMLPAHVAKALQEGRAVEPEYFDDCTILFSDIVGYTTIASALSPKEIMSMLDRLYSAFDSLTKRHSLFKVETIGDAYMVVGNVPIAQLDHAARVGKMALDMVEVAATIPVSESDHAFGCINIRIGLNSGPVVASVVGDLNPRYALFGDTVNVASRMESSSQANMIQLSETTKRRVEVQDPSLQLQFRGETNIKGKGSMRTYWLRPPGHMLLLSWMNGLVNRSEVDIEDLRNLPTVYLELAESEMELGQVLKFREFPIYEIAANVLTNNEDAVKLKEICRLPSGVLEDIESKEQLYVLVELKREKRDTLLNVLEEVLKDDKAFGIDDMMKIPSPLLHEIKDREQFEMFVGLSRDDQCKDFLTYSANLLKQEQPPGITIERILQSSLFMGTSCTSEHQTRHVLSWIIDEWDGIHFLGNILEEFDNGKDLKRRESPQSILEGSGHGMDMKARVNKKHILKILESIPQSVLYEVAEEEHLRKLIALGLPDDLEKELNLELQEEKEGEAGDSKQSLASSQSLGSKQSLASSQSLESKQSMETIAEEETVQSSGNIFKSMMVAMKQYKYSLDEILEFPTAILKKCSSPEEIDLVLKWRHSARFLPWVEEGIQGKTKFKLVDFLAIHHVLLNDCSNAEELFSICSMTKTLHQYDTQLDRLMTSVSDDTDYESFNPKKLMKWFIEVVSDGSGSVKSILAIPSEIWVHVLSKQNVVRLFEMKSAKCLKWTAEILQDNGVQLEDILVIPNRLLFSFASKEDLLWALNLAEHHARRVQTSEDIEGDTLSRNMTNNFIVDSHRYTLDKLQNAAVQKMVLKRTQLEEELRVLESKIDEEMHL